MLIRNQNLIPIILFRPLLWVVKESTAEKIRIMLLKATHAPFIAVIWGWERWDMFAMKREAAEREALSFGFGARASTIPPTQPKPIKAPVAGTAANKKHTLTKTGKVQVPALLISQASKRPSKHTGISQDTSKRVSTMPQAPAAGSAAGVSQVPSVAPGAPTTVPVAPGAGIGGSPDVVEMMRLLKELSGQVEEVRAALVKHDKGPSE